MWLVVLEDFRGQPVHFHSPSAFFLPLEVANQHFCFLLFSEGFNRRIFSEADPWSKLFIKFLAFRDFQNSLPKAEIGSVVSSSNLFSSCSSLVSPL